MKPAIAIAVGCALLAAGCSSVDQETTTETMSATPETASAAPQTSEAAVVTEATTADEVVAQLRSAGLCDDPGDFDVANMGDYYVAACGSPVPYLIAAQPWDGRVSAEWCRSSESPLAGKTVMVVQGADWTLIHPLASMGEMEAITDAIGGTAIPRSKACRT